MRHAASWPAASSTARLRAWDQAHCRARGGAVMTRATLLALPLLLLAACVTTNTNREIDTKEAAKATWRWHGLHAAGQPDARHGEAGARRKAGSEKPRRELGHGFAVRAPGHAKEADRNYQKAVELSPGNSQIANTYAVFLCRQGDVDRALPMFDKVIADKLYQTPYAAAANAGMCLREGKRNADAKRTSSVPCRWARASPMPPWAWATCRSPRVTPPARCAPWMASSRTAPSPPTCWWWGVRAAVGAARLPGHAEIHDAAAA